MKLIRVQGAHFAALMVAEFFGEAIGGADDVIAYGPAGMMVELFSPPDKVTSFPRLVNPAAQVVGACKLMVTDQKLVNTLQILHEVGAPEDLPISYKFDLPGGKGTSHNAAHRDKVEAIVTWHLGEALSPFLSEVGMISFLLHEAIAARTGRPLGPIAHLVLVPHETRSRLDAVNATRMHNSTPSGRQWFLGRDIRGWLDSVSDFFSKGGKVSPGNTHPFVRRILSPCHDHVQMSLLKDAAFRAKVPAMHEAMRRCDDPALVHACKEYVDWRLGEIKSPAS